jgi:uncharacterized protein YkwD
VKLNKKSLCVAVFFLFAACLSGETFAATDIYTSQPTFSPYYAGVVRQSVLEEALAEVNRLRALAGVPGDLTLNSDYTNKAQHGAVLMDANDVMSHYPTKPADMPQDFYELGYAGTSNGNIHYRWSSYNGVKTGNDSLLMAIKDWMADNNDHNIADVGHRRWILNPRARQTGFGISSRGGYSVMYVVDNGREDTYVYDYIPWPVKNAHPLDYFDSETPWSVTLHGSVYQKCDSGVKVKLTRTRDGQTWIFSAIGSDGYFNISNAIYEDCIVFLPGNAQYQQGETWSVDITGLKKQTGEEAVISYTTTFFNNADNNVDKPEDNVNKPGDNINKPGDNINKPDNSVDVPEGSSECEQKAGGCNSFGLGAVIMLLAVGTTLGKGVMYRCLK